MLHDHVAVFDRIAFGRHYAACSAENAVRVGHTIVLSRCSIVLRQRLEARGYTAMEAPLNIFRRSGGSACCLTLRLDLESPDPFGAAPMGDVPAQQGARL
jgi:N-dimethylarginine dimethylaminohydrolase